MMILSLVTKGSTVQKILSCQTLNNTTYDFRYCLRYCLLTFSPSASLTDSYMDSQAETDCKNTIFMLQFCPAGTIKSVPIGLQVYRLTTNIQKHLGTLAVFTSKWRYSLQSRGQLRVTLCRSPLSHAARTRWTVPVSEKASADTSTPVQIKVGLHKNIP